jgi:hypothetical protein
VFFLIRTYNLPIRYEIGQTGHTSGPSHRIRDATDRQTGSVALTGLKENNLVGTFHCQIFKRPDNATEPGFVKFLYVN